MNPLYTNS